MKLNYDVNGPTLKENDNIKLLNVNNVENYHGNSKASKNYSPGKETPQKVLPEAFTLWTQVLAALTTACIHLGIGVIGGFTGIALPALTDPQSSDVYLNIDQASLFSGIISIGSIVGSIITGIIMPWFGQRISLIITLPLGISGWIISAITSNYGLLIFARFIMGLLLATALNACSIYVAEISHTSIRGRLLAMLDLLRQLGYVFVAAIGSTSLHWRSVGLIGGLTSLIPPLVVLSFIPNSPRWLATKGRKDEAIKSLGFFRGKSFDVDKEMGEIITQLKENSAKKSNILDQLKLLASNKIRHKFFILALIMFLAHFAGNTVTAAYTITIFQSANTGIDDYISTVVSTSMRLFGAATYIIIADKCRRKLLLLVPLSFTAVSMVTLGAYFYLMSNQYNVQYILWLPLASMIVYLYTTGIYYSVLMLLSSELIPTAGRTVGVSIVFFLHSVGNFVCVYAYPYMIENMGSHWTYWFYDVNAFIIVLLTVLFIPETKGKTLEQIENLKWIK